MKRQDWLLIYLSLPSKEDLIDPIRIMKGLFLFKMRLKERLGDFYNYVPYLYGPCSFEIYDDLLELRVTGLVDEYARPFSRWSFYRLSKKGQERARILHDAAPSDLLKELQAIKEKVTSLSFLDLLREVYKQYPEYAKSSIITFGGTL
jgi:uncharacterized protein YwgA